MRNYIGKSLQIMIDTQEDHIKMTWIGQSDDKNPAETLNPYIENLIDEFKDKTLIIAFEKLEYMNSSTVPPIIWFLKLLNQNQIDTEITYSAKTKWQSASFKALETLSLTMDTIRVTGK